MMWCAVVLTFSLLSYWLNRRYGPRMGVTIPVLLSILCPTWITITLLGEGVDVRLGVMLAAVCIAGWLYPKHNPDNRWTVADYALVGLLVANLLSDTYHDGLQFKNVLRTAAEWLLPYIAGRWGLREPNDVRFVTPVACVVILLLGAWAVTEAVARENPANHVVGARPADRTPPVVVRWGVKRAEGPTRHPIWFGLTQVMLLPWAVVAARRAWRGEGPRWWYLVPAANLIGIALTVSRGSWIAALLVFYFLSVCRFPRARWPLIVAGALVAVVAMMQFERVTSWLEVTRPYDHVARTKVGDVEAIHTAATHRWMQFVAYRKAIFAAGWLGFGTERTSQYPVNVPLDDQALQTVTKFWTIDSEYLLLQLRFGVLGLGLFLLLGLASAARMLRMGCEIAAPGSTFMAALGAMLLAMMLTLFVEWMPYDFGFCLLFSCGAANSLHPKHGSAHRK